MNEIHQQRIESVQAGKNITHAQIEAKRSLREQLDRDLKEFLAKGKNVEVLPMGFTHFKDGKVPMRATSKKEKQQHAEARVETPTEVILEKNKSIRKLKNPVLKNSPAKVAKIQAIVIEQMNVIAEFYSKMHRGDKKRFCELCGITTKKLDNAKTGKGRIDEAHWRNIKAIMSGFVFTVPKQKTKRRYKRSEAPEALRRAQVIAARIQAEKDGKSVFKAPCKIHGMSDYYLHGKQPARCAKCRMEITKHHREVHLDAAQKDRKQRAEFNLAEAAKAVESGAFEFIGLCVRCGNSKMRVFNSKKSKTGYGYRCEKCTVESQKRYSEKRKAA